MKSDSVSALPNSCKLVDCTGEDVFDRTRFQVFPASLAFPVGQKQVGSVDSRTLWVQLLDEVCYIRVMANAVRIKPSA